MDASEGSCLDWEDDTLSNPYAEIPFTAEECPVFSSRPGPMRRANAISSRHTPFKASPSEPTSQIKQEQHAHKNSRATSNSQMARYARAYREAKKMETKKFEIKCKELEAEIERMAACNKKMLEENETLMKENCMLRQVIKYESRLAPILARVTGQNLCGSSVDIPPNVGMCLHVGGGGSSIEFCQQCNDSAAQGFSKSEFLPQLNLTSADFDTQDKL